MSIDRMRNTFRGWMDSQVGEMAVRVVAYSIEVGTISAVSGGIFNQFDNSVTDEIAEGFFSIAILSGTVVGGVVISTPIALLYTECMMTCIDWSLWLENRSRNLVFEAIHLFTYSPGQR